MQIQAPSKDERSIGIYAWLHIPKASFASALTLTVPDRLQSNILYAVKDATRRDSVSVTVPLHSAGEASILRFAGIPVA